MTSGAADARTELLEAVFSDDPAPDIHAAVVVSHSRRVPGCIVAAVAALRPDVGFQAVGVEGARHDTSNAIT